MINEKPEGTKQNGKYLLSGLITCPICGEKLTGDCETSKSGKVHEYYVCNNKEHERYTMRKSDTENLVLDEIGKILIQKNFAEIINKKYEGKNDKENSEKITIENIYNILNNFSKLFYASELDMEEKNKIIYLIIKEIQLYVSDDFKIREVSKIISIFN